MTKEQAIKELKYQEDMRAKEIDYKVNNLVIATAIESLEKQMFKFVECKGWNGHSGTRYKCPTCKKIIRCGYEYCSNCGQAVKFPKTKLVDGRIVLDWSEVE